MTDESSKKTRRTKSPEWRQWILVVIVSAVIGAGAAYGIVNPHTNAAILELQEKYDSTSGSLKDFYWAFCTERGQKWQNDAEAKKLCASVWKGVKMVSAEKNVPINPLTVVRVLEHESRFCTEGFGITGDTGCFQVNKIHGRYAGGCDLMDRECNIIRGIQIYADALLAFDGDERLALLAFNRGKWAVNAALRAGQNPANGYARKVMAI